MIPEQRELSAMFFLLFVACAVLVASILSYRVDARYAAERKRKFEEDMQRWDAENRARREQRMQEERIERQRMAEEARDLSERNRVALAHMIQKPEVPS
jgi:hypothetical protein